MQSVDEMRDLLRRYGYNIHNVREVEIGLIRTLHVSEEDAVAFACEIVKGA